MLYLWMSAAAILSDNSSGELYSVTGRLPLLHMNLKIVCMHNVNMTCMVSFWGGGGGGGGGGGEFALNLYCPPLNDTQEV